MKLKLKRTGAASQATTSQADPSTGTATPLAQPSASTAATPSRKRKEPSTGGVDEDGVEQAVTGPPPKRPSLGGATQQPSASGANMPPPRLKISLGARAAAAAAAAAAVASTPDSGPDPSTVTRPPAPPTGPPAGPVPSSARTALAGQAPLPSPIAGGPAAAPQRSLAAKGRFSEEARRIAMQVNQAFVPPAAAVVGTPGAGAPPGGPDGPGPGAGPPGPLVAPLPSGEGGAIKKIKLSVKMPNLASLAARIARGEPTGPEDGATAAGQGQAQGQPAGGAADAAVPGGVRGAGPGEVDGARAGTAAGPRPGAAPLGGGGTRPPGAAPRLTFKLKLPSMGASAGTGGGGGGAGAAAGGGAGASAKPLIITTTRPAAVAAKPVAAAGLDDDEDEDDDYGPDPDFALPRRGRGRGRGRGVRGGAAGRGAFGAGRSAAGASGRGGGAGTTAAAIVPAAPASAAIPTASGSACADAGGASKPRGRSADYASRFDLERCFEQIVKQDKDGLFAKPVTDEVAPGYSEVIKNPIDLSTIRERLRNGNYDTWGSLEAELLLMTNNAKTYNPEGSNAWWHADLMEKMTLKYISCGRQGMQNYRGVAASVWRDLRKPAEGASAIPLLPRYTSAGPRLDKNGNERDPAERRRQQQEANTETASLMLESRLRERRPGPGALRDDVMWPGAPGESRAGGPVGGGGASGMGMGAAGPAGGAAGGGFGAGVSGPGRRKHRNQGIRMIEADARRLMAAQAGDNRFSYRSKPPVSVAPFLNMGGLTNGASSEGLPYAVVRPSLQPAYLPCDSLADAYASSLARFIAKCGKAVQSAMLKRLLEPTPPPPPDPEKLAQEALQQQHQQLLQQQQQTAIMQQAAAVLHQQRQQQQQQQLAGMPGAVQMPPGHAQPPTTVGAGTGTTTQTATVLGMPGTVQLSQQPPQQPQQQQPMGLSLPGQVQPGLPLPQQQQELSRPSQQQPAQQQQQSVGLQQGPAAGQTQQLPTILPPPGAVLQQQQQQQQTAMLPLQRTLGFMQPSSLPHQQPLLPQAPQNQGQQPPPQQQQQQAANGYLLQPGPTQSVQGAGAAGGVRPGQYTQPPQQQSLPLAQQVQTQQPQQQPGLYLQPGQFAQPHTQYGFQSHSPFPQQIASAAQLPPQQ